MKGTGFLGNESRWTRYFLRLGAFLLLFLVIDKTICLIEQQFRSGDYKPFIESRLLYFEKPNEAEVVAIGDSHIADAFNTLAFEEITGLQSFNLGVYHSSPIEQYYLLREVFLHSSPKYVVLGTNPKMLFRPVSRSVYISVFLNSLLNRLSYYFHVAPGDLSFLSRASDEFFVFKRILTGNEMNSPRVVQETHHGYLKSCARNHLKSKSSSPNSFDPIQTQVEYVEKIIELVHDNNARLIITNLPLHEGLVEPYDVHQTLSAFEACIEQIAVLHGVTLLNPSHASMTNQFDDGDFLNAEHLNCFGAEKFTGMLAQSFTQYVD